MKYILIIAFISFTTISFSQEEKETKEHKVEIFTRIKFLNFSDHNIGFNYELKENLFLTGSANLFLSIIQTIPSPSPVIGNYMQRGFGGEIGLMKKFNKFSLSPMLFGGKLKKEMRFDDHIGYNLFIRTENNVDYNLFLGVKLTTAYNLSKRTNLFFTFGGAKAYGTKFSSVENEFEDTSFYTKEKLSYFWNINFGVQFNIFTM
jgi:hypothetical protein